jgi:Holliday junction resolvase RusA-like endonuclease
MIEFVVTMAPVPKCRPRYDRRSGRIYTPNKTGAFERQFRAAVAKHRPPQPLAGPLEVTVLCQVKKPQKKREHPHVRPDLDNYVKSILDALNDFWEDDAQIICLYARKRYGLIPLIKVEIRTPEEVERA